MTRLPASVIRRLVKRTGQNIVIPAPPGSEGRDTDKLNHGEASILFWIRTKAPELPQPRSFEHPEGQWVWEIGTHQWKWDVAWPQEKILVEIDGGVHGLKDKRQRDMMKRNELTLAGYTVLFFTTERVQNDPYYCIGCIQQAFEMRQKVIDPIIAGYNQGVREALDVAIHGTHEGAIAGIRALKK